MPTAPDVFDPSIEWEGFDATDADDGLGERHRHRDRRCAPSVVAVVPSNGCAGRRGRHQHRHHVLRAGDCRASAFGLCCTARRVTAFASGGPVDIHRSTRRSRSRRCDLQPSPSWPRRSTDQDANDPPTPWRRTSPARSPLIDPCAAPFTPIPQIQGSGATVALTGTQHHEGCRRRRLRGSRRPHSAGSSSRTRPATATPLPLTASSCSRATTTASASATSSG